MTAIVRRFFDRTVTACAVVAGVLLLAQMIAICADVFMRFAFDRPINGVNALAEWSLVYIAFLGAAWLQREKGHVSVDILLVMLPGRLSSVLDVTRLAMGILVTGFVAVFGTWVAWIKFAENEYDFFKLAWMPIWVIYAVIPFGAALWLVQLCLDAGAAVRGARRASSARPRPAEDASE